MASIHIRRACEFHRLESNPVKSIAAEPPLEELADLQGTQPASAAGVGVREPCLGSKRVCCLKKLAVPPGLRLPRLCVK